MTVDDAIELVKEKDKRKIRCQCPDCDAQTALVAEVERLRSENAVYKQFSAVHDQAEHDAFMRGREVALEYLPDERNQLLAEVKELRKLEPLERDGIRLLLDLVPEMLRKAPSVQAAIAYLTKRVY